MMSFENTDLLTIAYHFARYLAFKPSHAPTAAAQKQCSDHRDYPMPEE